MRSVCEPIGSHALARQPIPQFAEGPGPGTWNIYGASSASLHLASGLRNSDPIQNLWAIWMRMRRCTASRTWPLALAMCVPISMGVLDFNDWQGRKLAESDTPRYTKPLAA